MGNQAISGLAALVVVTFLVMAVTACASSERATQAEAIPAEGVEGVPEFHGARIGTDTLRSRLDSE